MTAPNTTAAHLEVDALRDELRDLEQRARIAAPREAHAMHERAVDIANTLAALRILVGAL